jgi:hypothetical protein
VTRQKSARGPDMRGVMMNHVKYSYILNVLRVYLYAIYRDNKSKV